jgi:hypothetical protein
MPAIEPASQRRIFRIFQRHSPPEQVPGSQNHAGTRTRVVRRLDLVPSAHRARCRSPPAKDASVERLLFSLC